MRHRLFALFTVVLVAFTATQAALAQTPDSVRTVRLELQDGSVVTGTVMGEDDAAITIRTGTGIVMSLQRDQIKEMQDVSAQRFWRIDPNQSRILFAPTARALPKGQGYVADYELLFPFVAYGVGSGVTLAGGISIIPGASGQLLYLAPKLTLLEDEKGSLAVGVLALTGVGDLDDFGGAGLLYGVGTLGGAEQSATLGLAIGYADGEVGSHPALMLGLEKQVSNSLKLVSENYWIVGVAEALLVSGGVRFFGDRVAVDLSLFTAPAILDELDGFPFLPWVGFAYNFGRQK